MKILCDCGKDLKLVPYIEGEAIAICKKCKVAWICRDVDYYEAAEEIDNL